MMGAVIKSYFAEREGIDPAKIVSVSIMPCTAKKFEAGRPEMAQDYVPDVDYVLTTREAAQLLRMSGVGMIGIEPEAADTPFGERSTAGKIFGAVGRRHGGRGPHRALHDHRQGAARPRRSSRCAGSTAPRS